MRCSTYIFLVVLKKRLQMLQINPFIRYLCMEYKNIINSISISINIQQKSYSWLPDRLKVAQIESGQI